MSGQSLDRTIFIPALSPKVSLREVMSSCCILFRQIGRMVDRKIRDVPAGYRELSCHPVVVHLEQALRRRVRKDIFNAEFLAERAVESFVSRIARNGTDASRVAANRSV